MKVVLTKAIPESTPELIREHKRLVAILRSPSHTDDLAEADKQEDELEEYEDEVAKAFTDTRADAALQYRMRLINAQMAPLMVAAGHDSRARETLERLLQERFSIMVALGEAAM